MKMKISFSLAVLRDPVVLVDEEVAEDSEGALERAGPQPLDQALARIGREPVRGQGAADLPPLPGQRRLRLDSESRHNAGRVIPAQQANRPTLLPKVRQTSIARDFTGNTHGYISY